MILKNFYHFATSAQIIVRIYVEIDARHASRIICSHLSHSVCEPYFYFDPRVNNLLALQNENIPITKLFYQQKFCHWLNFIQSQI